MIKNLFSPNRPFGSGSTALVRWPPPLARFARWVSTERAQGAYEGAEIRGS